MSKRESRSDKEWPHVGLERHVSYASGFYHLNLSLGSADACSNYYSGWMKRYQALMSTWHPVDIAVWSVRMRRSLKAAFNATHFAVSADHARECGLPESYYFLSYYAAFHAMWSVMFLHPDESSVNIARTTHSKLLNIFVSAFASGRGRIISYDMRKIVEDLKFMREYYSYQMPMNYPFAQARDLTVSAASTGGVVKHCLQLANLQSHIIQEAAQRQRVFSTRVTLDFVDEFTATFGMLSRPEHPNREALPLEPSDAHALREMKRDGCELYAHSIMLEHFTDEYMTYGDDQEIRSPLVAKTSGLVWNAFH